MKPVFDPAELAGWCGGRWTRLPEAALTGFIQDTRHLEPGDLFVALPGARQDGHVFVEQAFARGAAGALVQAGRAGGGDRRPLLEVPDPLAALQAIARAHRARASARVVGVTGSVGKTTVKELLAALLETRGPTARTAKNWNNDIGLPLSLLRLAPGYHRFGVFEAGTSHPGEIESLCAILKPDVGVVTLAGPVHLEHFGSVEAIAREKSMLLRSLPADGVAVVNRDTPCFACFREAAPGRLVTVSAADRTADYWLEGVEPAGARGQRVRARERGEPCAFSLSLPGRHQALNALLALAVARAWGVDWPAADRVLSTFVPLDMRWQVVEAGGVTLINDAYNANPVSMAGALETFRDTPCQGRKWLILGEMRELGPAGPAFHAELGGLVARGPWAGVAAVGPLAVPLVERARQQGMGANRIWPARDAEEAAASLKPLLKTGDMVLLKASRGVALERAAHALGAPTGEAH